MDKKFFDLIVLGAGPGGYAAAIRASQLGKKVALVEKEELGGVCLNKGCIPTKTFIEYVETLENINRAKDWGVDLEIKATHYQKFLERKEKIINSLISGLKKILLSYGIEIYRGKGRLIDANTLEIVETKTSRLSRLQSSRLIIASGSAPKRFPPFDFTDKNLITSNEALEFKNIPKEIVIVGGGVIGCEFASIFSGLGVKVILIELEERLLPAEDKEIAHQLEAIFRKGQIEIYFQTRVEKLESKKDFLSLELSNGKVISGEKVLICLGRTPNSQIGDGEEISLKSNNGGIKVDERLETNLKGVYAVGDVLGGPFLAHLAYQQGIAAAENAFGGNSFIDNTTLPIGIYTRPEIARVGLTEEEAKRGGKRIRIGRFPFAALSRALIRNERQGLFKIISNEEDGEILGIHILGKGATDLIAEGVLAIKSGLTAKDLARVIHGHPTFNEGIRSAAEDVNNEAIHLLPRVHPQRH